MKQLKILLPSFCMQPEWVQDAMLRSAKEHINNNGVVVVTESGNEIHIQFTDYEELKEYLSNYCSSLKK